MALSAATARKRRSLHLLEKGYAAVATGSTVYQGSLVSLVESSGRLKATSATAGEAFVGVCAETATGNTAGTVYANYEYGHVELITAKTALTTTYLMCNACGADDDNVTTLSAISAAKRAVIGQIVEFDSSGNAWVWIGHYSTKSAP